MSESVALAFGSYYYGILSLLLIRTCLDSVSRINKMYTHKFGSTGTFRTKVICLANTIYLVFQSVIIAPPMDGLGSKLRLAL